MLTQTFSHIPGLGALTEKTLWQQGCFSWDQFLEDPEGYNIGGCSRQLLIDKVRESKEAYEAGNHQFFNQALSSRMAWRAWPEFKHKAVYLDIETDGGQGGNAITMIGLYDGEFTCYTRDEGLGAFRDKISEYSMIVTFFGAGFDIPMIKRKFPDLVLDQIHLDLCFALKQVGMRGGLKKIEKEVGIARPEEAAGLNGLDAIRLWNLYERHGDDSALETLIAYNREDVVNLETLAKIAYHKLVLQTTREAGLAEGLGTFQEGKLSLF